MNSHMIITLNLKDGSILLNEYVLNALDWPKQIQILINQAEKKLVLRPCTVEDLGAVVIPNGRIEPCEISARLFLKRIRELVGWEDKLPRACSGEYIPANHAVLFRLEEAQLLDLVQE